VVIAFGHGLVLGRRRVQQLPSQRQILPARGIGEQAVVSDAVEAGGQDVDQETADELVGRERKAKAQVMIELEKFIKAKKLTQAQAAEILGVPRPRINRLLKGDFRNITLDKMGEMVSRAGMTLEVKVRKPRRKAASKSAAAA